MATCPAKFGQQPEASLALNVDQISYRCPTAKVYGQGILAGYRLLFKGTLGKQSIAGYRFLKSRQVYAFFLLCDNETINRIVQRMVLSYNKYRQ